MMKKNVMTLAAVLCCTLSMMVQTACTNEDNPVKPQIGKASITVDTKALYDELGMTDQVTQILAGGYAVLTDTVLIYDQTGALVTKLGKESSSLQPLHFQLNALPNGKYTLVGWQCMRSTISENRCWIAAGQEQLATLNISTPNDCVGNVWALGAATATVTIDGGMIEAAVAPKAMGSTIDIQVEGEAEYKHLRLYALKEWTYGCYLDPNRTEEDRWMVKTDDFYAATIAQLTTGHTEGKYFTLCHGDDMFMAMWDTGGTEVKHIATSEHQKMHAGDRMKYYVHLDRTGYQPPYFAPIEGFAAWKADRDAGILVFNPYLKFGCNIDEVEQYVSQKLYWRKSFNKLRYKDEMAAWYRDYLIADNFTEKYVFKTEKGEQMLYVICLCPDITVEMANNTLLKQGFVYSGKIQFPGYDTRDIFFSADGQIEVHTFVLDNETQIVYQPTDPNDLQYIVK